jgi:hypothetical protein
VQEALAFLLMTLKGLFSPFQYFKGGLKMRNFIMLLLFLWFLAACSAFALQQGLPFAGFFYVVFWISQIGLGLGILVDEIEQQNAGRL